MDRRTPQDSHRQTLKTFQELSLTLFTRTFFLDFVCYFINFYTSDFLFITTSDLFTQHSVVYHPCLFGAVFPPGPND